MKMNKVKEDTDGARGWYLFGSEGYMLTGYQADPSGGVFLLFPAKGGRRENAGLQMPEACCG